MPPDSLSRPEPESPTPAAATLPDPMVMGTTLLDRYTIIEILPSNNGANVYRVAEIRACPHCGVENEGNLNHCGFCGTELPAPRTLVLVERPATENGESTPAAFVLSNMAFSLTAESTHAPEALPRALAWRYAYSSDTGLARALRGEPNEDSVLAFRLSSRHAKTAQEIGVWLIADGVGGAAAGEVASEMAALTIAQGLVAALLNSAPDTSLSEEDVRDTMRAAISEANQQVIEYGQSHSLSLGTTVALALLYESCIYIANVGDSRAYLFRRNELTQITRDHSYVAELVARGELTADEARTHPKRNLILRSLGDPTGFDVDLFPPDEGGLIPATGDKILLCSDGLWEMVGDEAIAQVLAQPLDAAQACAQLVSFANAGGGVDNISVLILEVTGNA